jgi:DNA binding domain, excisionase family
MTVPPDKTTFTLAEAAEVLSCHKETLRRAIRQGVLRAAKLGKGFRISRVDLEAYWTASGGGELFRDPEKTSDTLPVKPHAAGDKKKPAQMQLSLPGTRTESDEE